MNNDCWAVVPISCWRCNSSGPIRAGNLSSGLCLMEEADEKPEEMTTQRIALHICELMRRVRKHLSQGGLKVGYMQPQGTNTSINNTRHIRTPLSAAVFNLAITKMEWRTRANSGHWM